MSISNCAATGDHTLTVSQLATAHKVIGTSVAYHLAALGAPARGVLDRDGPGDRDHGGIAGVRERELRAVREVA